MAAKKITIELDLETAEFSVDLNGFHGKGCEDIQRAFDDISERTKDIRKPEYFQQNTGLVRK